jgi:hypothetical protein
MCTWVGFSMNDQWALVESTRSMTSRTNTQLIKRHALIRLLQSTPTYLVIFPLIYGLMEAMTSAVTSDPTSNSQQKYVWPTPAPARARHHRRQNEEWKHDNDCIDWDGFMGSIDVSFPVIIFTGVVQLKNAALKQLLHYIYTGDRNVFHILLGFGLPQWLWNYVFN